MITLVIKQPRQFCDCASLDLTICGCESAPGEEWDNRRQIINYKLALQMLLV